MTIDQRGWEDISATFEEAYERIAPILRALAAHPNTYAKISGIGMTDHNWTTASLRPIVLDVIDAFGPDRAMFASNFPVDSLYSTFDTLYAAFDEVTASGFTLPNCARVAATVSISTGTWLPSTAVMASPEPL